MEPRKIDLIGLARDVWRGRGVVVRTVCVCVAVGLVVALFGEVKYGARAVVVPQTDDRSESGNFQGLAAVAGMAGIDLSGVGGSGGLSPGLYPMVVASVPFQKELMATAVPVDGREGEVTLIDYFTERGYRPFSLFPFIRDYTVGLPRTILDAVRRGLPAPTVPSEGGERMQGLSGREYECLRRLAGRVTVEVNEKSGYITIAATMPEARMSAAVARRAQELLQEFVTRFKAQKAQAELDFIDERYGEVKVDFEARQRALAEFQDSHSDITSALARTAESRLDNEYRLAFSLYSELAAQREQARIAVKKNTPVFTVIEPVAVPVERAAPKRMRTMMASVVAGVMLGAALALVWPRLSWPSAARRTGTKKRR